MTLTTSPKRFIVLGDSGAGKSAFINFLYNYYNGTRKSEEVFCSHPKVKIAIPCANWSDCLDEKYKNNASEFNINDQTKSQTQKCTTYEIQEENVYLKLIDTPGFNDTNDVDNDEKNLELIEKVLKEDLSLCGIIIVLNGSIPRAGVSFHHFLHMLRQVWPNDLFNNCVVVLTNCDELSVNLDLSTLQRYFKIDDNQTFHLQNSLFRWNPKKPLEKSKRSFQNNFEENLKTIQTVVEKLMQFKDVSTESYEIQSMKALFIERLISKSIQHMMILVENYKKQKISMSAIERARDTMKKSENWKKNEEINLVHFRGNQSHLSSSKTLPDRRLSFAGVSGDSRERRMTDQMHRLTYCEDNIMGSHEEQLNTALSTCYSRDDRQYQNTDQMWNNCSYSDKAVNSKLPSFMTSEHQQHEGTNLYYRHISHGKSDRSQDLSRSRKYEDYKPGMKPSSSSSNHNQSKHSNFNKSSCEPQQTTIRVTLPDNEARSHHQHAQREESKLIQQWNDLVRQQQQLKKDMENLMEQLKNEVVKLKSINENYNIIEKCHGPLQKFKDTIDSMENDEQMTSYYHETLNILETSPRSLNTKGEKADTSGSNRIQ